MSVSIIDNPYALALMTDIRDADTPGEIIRKRLYDLGRITAELIIGDGLVSTKEITTPMGGCFSGFSLPRTTTVIVSTRDDYEYFANGVASAYPVSCRGYMDFGGARGLEALQSKRRAYDYPSLKIGEIADTLVIAKSILATGCTAISLTQSAISKYHPKKVIIAAIFYSQQGIEELIAEIPNIEKIYIHGNPDSLNGDGMLVPGVGNLDARLCN